MNSCYKYLLSWAVVMAASSAGSLSADQAEPSGASEFVKFTSTGEDEGHVDTAVTTFRSEDGVEVALVSALHIADRSYYVELNERFEAYDAVLYEMIKDDETRPEEISGSGHPISQLQIGMKTMLGLEFQLEGIDYTKHNFVHADMDPETFSRLQGEKGENILTLLIQAALQERQMLLSGQSRPMSGFDLLIALTSDDSAHALKWLFAQQMNQIEMMLAGIDQGMDGSGSVIVTERNKVAMRVLREQIAEGKQSLAVFYGAGHMPDLQKRLLESDFMQVKEEWITAWDIRRDP